MLQIVIPLAGKAARFQEKGHTFPKPLFEIGNRSMIEVVLGNLAPPPPVQFTFICRKEHLSQFYLGDMLQLLAPGSRVISLENETAGAQFVAGDWLDNGFPDASFDAAIAIESSEHMPDLPRFFAQARAMVVPVFRKMFLRSSNSRVTRATTSNS